MRDVEVPNWLKDLPLAPEFHPTDTEFADPIAYISKIEKEASAFGICKVIPPLPKPSKKYVLSNLNKSLSKCPELGNDVCSKLDTKDKVNGGDGDFRAVFTTRHQELGLSGKKTKGAGQPQPPAVHKQVWQSGEVYTLDQFESKSKTFARSQLGMVKEVSPLVIEALFWKAACEKPIYIEYANDVPGSGFGEPQGPLRFFNRQRRRRRRRTFKRNDQGCSGDKKEEADEMRNYDENKGETIECSHNPSADILKEKTSSMNAVSDQTSCVPKHKGLNDGNDMEGSSGWKLSNSPWNLQVIARSPGSLTRFMPDDIPGVTSPMIYIGMLFSWFAWHVEDHELHSLNFLHMGSPKTWYSIPGDYAFTFEEVIRKKAYGGGIDRFAALTLLGEKTTLLSPEVIVASGIPCCRLVQNPGEFVVTFPRAYHIGFSHGFNCGEAANFGTPKWLTVAKEAAVRRAAMNYLPMLSHQQLLYLLTMSFISRVPRSLLPGVRSSRLKDRQKEERELLVKRAFVEDILNENKLLTSLLQKSSSYHAVLWDLDSLPSSNKESDLSGSIDAVVTTPIDIVHSKNDNHQDVFNQMSLYLESANDLYMDDDDMSTDFQVDSGTLPCVACGVLGFPFMSVVQPSEKASMDFMPTDLVQDLGTSNAMVSNFTSDLCSMVEGTVSDGLGAIDKIANDKRCSDHPNGVSSKASSSAEEESLVSGSSPPPKISSDSSKVNFEQGWIMSSGSLRPRIFCLEHASRIEELLHPKGGAKLLVICHSDFQKIKAHAAAIAEQIGSPFSYNEILLDDASQDDLNLINLAIDDEQEAECSEDWTSRLNINLRQCVKLRNKSSSEKALRALSLDALFDDTTPCSNALIVKWHATKSRSKRNLKHPDHSIPSTSTPVLKDKGLEAKSDAHMTRKEGTIIQYSRRTLKSKLQGSAADRGRIGIKGNNSLESEQENRSRGTIGDPRENSYPSHIADSLLPMSLVVENVGAQTENHPSKETALKDKMCDPMMDDFKRQNEVEVADGKSEQNDRFYSGSSPDILATNIQDNNNTETNEKNQIMEETSLTNGISNLVPKNNFGGVSNSQAAGDALMQVSHEPAMHVESYADESVVRYFDEQTEKRIVDCENKNDRVQQVVEASDSGQPVSDTATLTDVSTPASAEGSTEVPREASAADETYSGGEDCSPLAKRELNSTNSTVQSRSTSRNGSKRKRELELQREEQLGVDGFIRSPCEGLRPRGGKDVNRSKIDDKRIVDEEKPAKKMAKKSSNNSLPSNNKKENPRKGSHMCDLEGCRMSFQTKAELLLHKRNRCPHEGCGKKFSSHKYAVLHLRVHVDDRPLKCTWKGCTMTFKWAWARTEHLRVHTGERPYKCKVEGCGLTFRFVSDYSRHRRKTGHYVN